MPVHKCGLCIRYVVQLCNTGWCWTVFTSGSHCRKNKHDASAQTSLQGLLNLCPC